MARFLFSNQGRLLELMVVTPNMRFAALRYGLDGFEGERAETLRGLLELPFQA